MDAAQSLYLVLGGLLGVALGAWFYSLANADALRLLIGVIMRFWMWQMANGRG